MDTLRQSADRNLDVLNAEVTIQVTVVQYKRQRPVAFTALATILSQTGAAQNTSAKKI